MGHIDVGFGEQEGVLTLSESVTVEDAGEVREAIVNLLHASEAATIKVSGVTHTDVFVLQLLCSAHITACRMGKGMVLDAGGNDVLCDVARQTGMMPSDGRCVAVDGPCLWARS